MFTLIERNLQTGAERVSKFATLAGAIAEGQDLYGVDLTNGTVKVGNWEYEITGGPFAS